MERNTIASICKRASEAFSTSERVNFESLWQNAAALCRPSGNTVLGVRSPGEKKPVDRLIDVGINSLNVFTSGVASTLTPKGARFFEYSLSKTSDIPAVNEVKRWLNDCSAIALDFINESNFFTETTKLYSDLGLIGTAMLMTEPDSNTGIRFKTFYITNFAFDENSKGMVDKVYMKMCLTAEQLVQKFGYEELTSKMQDAYDRHSTERFCIIHAIYPRTEFESGTLNPKKMPIASVYVEESTKELILESGFPLLPGAVGRWTQASNEIYGRSPATECLGNLSMLNTMEYTKLRSAQRVASPQWLCPDDGSVRNLNNNSGGIVYWNAGNPNAKPEQIISRDAPQLTDAYIQQRNIEIEDSFYVGVWNPLRGMGKQATATEVDHRVALAKQNLVPKISRITDEILQPTFKRIFQILKDTGMFPAPPVDINEKDIRVNFTSTAGLLLQQVESAAVLRMVETMAMLSQIDPEVMDYLDTSAVVKSTAEANSVPNTVIRSDNEVKKIRAARAEAKAQQQQQMQQQALAQAYSQTNKAPEEGSPASILMGQGGV